MLQTVNIFTTHKRSLGQGNIFTPICHSVHRGGMHGLPGGMHGCQGACMVGVVCVIAGGVGVVAGGNVWLWGGVRGC